MTGPRDIPIETFDALLRDLVTWNLVVPEEREGEQGWQLAPAAQRRLSELTRACAPWPVERTAYFGRRCADCGRREPTRLREGAQICESCWQERVARSQVVASPEAEPEPSRRWMRRRRREIA